MNNLSSGETASEPPLPCHHIPALVFGTLLILLILAGNLLVCLGVCTEPPLRTATNIFIASLAVSDLLLALLVLPLYVFQEFQGGLWTLGPGLCDYLMTMDVMLCTASIFNLCAISVDRFIAISIPLNYNRKHVDVRQVVLISMTWILAFAVASPIAFGLNHVPDRNTSVCQLEGSSYIIWSSVCSFLLPCPAMLLLYCGMLRGLRRWEQGRSHRLQRHMHGFRKMDGSPSEPRSPPALTQSPRVELHLCSDPASEPTEGPKIALTSSQLKYAQPRPGKRKRARINGREHKAMKVLPIVVGHIVAAKVQDTGKWVTVEKQKGVKEPVQSTPVAIPSTTGAFLFCWTPFFVVHVMRASCQTCNIPPQLISTVTWLGYVNSALNPIIYTIFNQKFRNFFRKILHPCC